MKHRITLTSQEISVLAHITRNLADYATGDDREDHGINNLMQYRGSKYAYQHLISAMGKLNRLDRKIKFKKL